jgi:hypothetical protein
MSTPSADFIVTGKRENRTQSERRALNEDITGEMALGLNIVP